MCPIQGVTWQDYPKADLDRSCSVDSRDFAVFALAWQSTPGDDNWSCQCDIGSEADGCINAVDLQAFAGYWLTDVGR